MNDNIRTFADVIKETNVGRYLFLRPASVPFSHESMLIWQRLLDANRHFASTDGYLELGVQHGGSALLAMSQINGAEPVVLVDVKKSEIFGACLSLLHESELQSVVFYECRTDSEDLNNIIGQRFRWVHIDAGHTYQLVKHDISRFAGNVCKGGLLVLDDFMQPRWPAVSQAIFDTHFKAFDLQPLLVCFNKLYMCHHDDYEKYSDKICNEIYPAISNYGVFNLWDDIECMGSRCITITGHLSADCRAHIRAFGEHHK